jgi:hypothetical protein
MARGERHVEAVVDQMRICEAVEARRLLDRNS